MVALIPFGSARHAYTASARLQILDTGVAKQDERAVQRTPVGCTEELIRYRSQELPDREDTMQFPEKCLHPSPVAPSKPTLIPSPVKPCHREANGLPFLSFLSHLLSPGI